MVYVTRVVAILSPLNHEQMYVNRRDCSAPFHLSVSSQKSAITRSREAATLLWYLLCSLRRSGVRAEPGGIGSATRWGVFNEQYPTKFLLHPPKERSYTRGFLPHSVVNGRNETTRSQRQGRTTALGRNYRNKFKPSTEGVLRLSRSSHRKHGEYVLDKERVKKAGISPPPRVHPSTSSA